MKQNSTTDFNFFTGGKVKNLPPTKLLIVFIWVLLLIVTANSKAASITDTQESVVTGQVTDAQTGETLPGVSVVIKGTMIGTVTDQDGNYSITVESPSTVLVFSFVGMQTKEVIVGDRNIINVELSFEAVGLSEVVMIGYGSQVKATLTGSVTQQRGEDLQRVPALSLSNTLSGMFTGLKTINESGEPGSDDAALFIRGQSTLGDTRPLIVIDGVPEREGLNNINPRDVESISILKDASAAIYGARAANGVILITTKRGETGKPRINYNYNQGFVTPTRIPEYANSWDLALFQNEQMIREGQPPRWSDEEIQKFRDGSDPLNYPNTNWRDQVIQDITLQNSHNLSVRGGTESIKYYLSGNFSNQDDIFVHSDGGYQVAGLRSNIDATASDILTVSLDLSFTESNRNSPATSYGGITSAAWNHYPYQHLFYPNGLPGDGPRGEGDNPALLAGPENGYSRNKFNNYQTKLGFNLDIPIDGLTLDGYIAYDLINSQRKSFDKPFTFYRYDSNTEIYEAVQRGTPPQLNERFNFASTIIGHMKLNYQYITNEHRFSSFIAGEISESKSNWFSGERRDFVSPAVDQLFAGGAASQFADGNAGENARMNFFSRISHVYKNRYMIDINLRYDGSTAFPKGNRWGFFPGASVGWILSEEAFFKDNVNFINHFKLRGSYGLLGNDRISPFQFLGTYSFTGGAFFGTSKNRYTGLTQDVEPNAHITWEVAEMLNFGFDAQFFDGKFGLTFDRFFTERSNILSRRNATVPEYTGIVLPLENIGIVENRGYEIEVFHQNRIGDFTYRISPIVSYAKNKVVFIDEPEGVLDHQRREGNKMGSTLNLIVLGIYRSQEEIDNSPHWPGTQVNDLQYLDVDGDGVITLNDRVRQNKSNIPEYTFGSNFSVGYKNFDFSMLWQGATNVWRRIWIPQGLFGNILQDHFDNRPHEGNPNSEYPNITYDNSQVSALDSEWTHRDASYLRLKNLEVGYTLSIERMNISNVRIYANGFNLLTFDKLKWFDPEGDDERGRFYPQNRIFNLGVSVTF